MLLFPTVSNGYSQVLAFVGFDFDVDFDTVVVEHLNSLVTSSMLFSIVCQVYD